MTGTYAAGHRGRLTARLAIGVASLALLLAACGDDAGSNSAGEPGTGGTTATSPAAPTPAATPAATPAPAAQPAAPAVADYTPGDLRFRVVNLLDEAVDVYVRTTGMVQAFPVDLGVESGATTEYRAPPEGGRFVVTTAGAGNPTCVTGCSHFVSDDRLVAEDGDAHTVVLYRSGTTARAFRLWENAPAQRVGTAANALAPAVDEAGLVVVTAIALRNADFGLRLAFAGVEGCQSPANLTNVLVGGNQTPAFALDGPSVEIVLHDNRDTSCSNAPVGGPFTVSGGPGTRSHLILYGSPGSMEGIVLPMDGAGG